MLLDSVRGVPGVLTDPAPDAVTLDFADSSITYGLRYWIEDFGRDAPIDAEVRTRIWYAAQRGGYEIPFPIRTVLKTEVTDEQADRERAREAGERSRALSRTDLFSGLDRPELEQLASDTRTARYSTGEIIIRQGEAGESLYLVQRGEVLVRLSVDGVERDVATIRAGQFFGEMSLMTGEPRRATCLAKSDVVCYVVDSRAVSALLTSKPQVAEVISGVLGERQSALEGERDNLSAEARARRAAENSSRLLRRIRDFFNLG
jgi:CRP-like cAMP-binding protein